jgi:hypothetical protein
MLDRIRGFVAWVYDWITVIAASLVGLPSMILEFLDLLGGTDLTPILPPEMAVKIITCVAIVKALCAWAVQQKAAQS